MREWLFGSSTSSGCCCDTAIEGGRLVVLADECPGGGDLAASADCRATVVDSLSSTGVDTVVTEQAGQERVYAERAAAVLTAAGRFATRVTSLDDRLADRARRDPVAAAEEAIGRSGPIADLAAETGLAVATEGFDTSEQALPAYTGPTISDARVGAAPPADAALRDQQALSTEAVVRRYDTRGDHLPMYHIEPREQRFDADTMETLAEAYRRVATAAAADGGCHPYDAATTVAGDSTTATAVGAVLEKHTGGLGILEDIFADQRVSDVFATAPVSDTRLRLRCDGETMRTNVRLTPAGANTLASTFRRASGRAFSRASPTLDATATVADRQIRVAGVSEPVSDGLAFAFRAHDSDVWRLADFVDNGTMPAAVAGLLSIAAERGGACLVAGPRGAGKTTTLGALLWELPHEVRTILIEDTPELPASSLRSDGRDVQALRTASGDGPSVDATAALRTALRLGEGALVVGEVRGEEAGVLYEAMRVGGGDGAVLGTIHGNGPEAVRERLVSDLGVPVQSFAATDLVVTLAPPASAHGRGIASVAEIVSHGEEISFEMLYKRDGSTATATGRLKRGSSRLVESLAAPGESYTELLDAIEARTERFEESVAVEARGNEPDTDEGQP
ncbi:Type IV secretory pathway ATPase VirB11/Archaellum biosynthesis ATPase [Haloarcula vallismortis]|uniref:Type II secretion system protein E n=2 Tax=Haloarcula vallismortis TaxID=28442 RepID=M0JGK1_HALVA|nr:ATPase, T2SS/T4P/T4SS family [Haloarcula vallismortis]EMA06820.1 type II secretion system protein E [Haloarcula vallismortis ATCC 29715]SDW66426.1 Type IV secretory pathway ATPase VirB11/Archaellum biosynthesis ATPase [Haloarcula vallismortis]